MSETEPGSPPPERPNSEVTTRPRAPAVESPPPFRPGDTIGRYQIHGVLGAGGMGLVYTAFDLRLERTVALKIILPSRGGPRSRARTRLLREAQALAKLQHPNVVTIHDVGADGDQVFIAMELVPGRTLGNWLAASERSWRAIRDVFLAAGRGLVAAHAVGIVHRDFKPSNVIVGADRVVVVDFGLAITSDADVLGEGSEPSGPARSIVELHLTLTGERVGTPRYMAPEQHSGAPVSPLADQFAFANALWAALHGAAPFTGETLDELRAQIAKGPAPPSASKIPPRVEQALRRALALRPRDRWPNLGDLLAELAHDPAATRRRRFFLAAVGCSVVAVGAAAFGLGRNVAMPELCSGAEALVAPLWDQTTQERTRAAFNKSGRPSADETFARVDASLRRRLGAWANAHREACLATEARHEQSAELLDARMACLGRARRAVGALVTVLTEADGPAVDRAAVAATTIGDISECDSPSLRDIVPVPTDPAQAHEVERLRGEVAHLEALRVLGKVEEGLTAGHEIVERARAADYLPVLAAALDLTAWFEMTAGHDDASIQLGYETARVAAAAHDDNLVASGLVGVAMTLGFDEQRFDGAEAAYQSAVAAAARAGNPGLLLEKLFGDRENILYQKGEYLPVLPLCQIVFALSVRLHGPESYQTAVSLSELAGATGTLGYPREAAAMFRRAMVIAETALGPDHLFVNSIIGNAGASLLDAEDFESAAPFCERFLFGLEKLGYHDDPRVAIAAHNLGMVRRGQRRLGEARTLLQRALQIRIEKLGPDHPMVSSNLGELAEVEVLEGRREAALEELDRAIAIEKRAFTTAHPALVRRYRAKAEVLLGLGRLDDARANLALAEAAFTQAGAPLTERAPLLALSAEIARGSHRPGEAAALYAKALPALEAQLGRNAPALVDVLLGLGETQLDLGDGESALATAERAVTIGTYTPAPIDRLCAAQFLLARARWAMGQDRAGATALARKTRAQLVALSFPTDTLPEIEHWLARR